MRGKILFATGLAVGYVLGTKAGRERYEQIAAAANKFWSAPTVQRRVDAVEDFVKDHAPDVAEFVGDTAKKAVSKVAAKPKRSTGSTGSTGPTGSAGSTGPTTRKPSSGRGPSTAS